MMNAFRYLERAEHYCEARGDDMFFKNLYTSFREYNGVEDSVWKTLSYLYSNGVADLLTDRYWSTIARSNSK